MDRLKRLQTSLAMAAVALGLVFGLAAFIDSRQVRADNNRLRAEIQLVQPEAWAPIGELNDQIVLNRAGGAEVPTWQVGTKLIVEGTKCYRPHPETGGRPDDIAIESPGAFMRAVRPPGYPNDQPREEDWVLAGVVDADRLKLADNGQWCFTFDGENAFENLISPKDTAWACQQIARGRTPIAEYVGPERGASPDERVAVERAWKTVPFEIVDQTGACPT